jgi:hypothetical protein
LAIAAGGCVGIWYGSCWNQRFQKGTCSGAGVELTVDVVVVELGAKRLVTVVPGVDVEHGPETTVPPAVHDEHGPETTVVPGVHDEHGPETTVVPGVHDEHGLATILPPGVPAWHGHGLETTVPLGVQLGHGLDTMVPLVRGGTGTPGGAVWLWPQWKMRVTMPPWGALGTAGPAVPGPMSTMVMISPLSTAWTWRAVAPSAVFHTLRTRQRCSGLPASLTEISASDDAAAAGFGVEACWPQQRPGSASAATSVAFQYVRTIERVSLLRPGASAWKLPAG